MRSDLKQREHGRLVAQILEQFCLNFSHSGTKRDSILSFALFPLLQRKIALVRHVSRSERSRSPHARCFLLLARLLLERLIGSVEPGLLSEFCRSQPY
jgi:hypothetical protein